MGRGEGIDMRVIKASRVREFWELHRRAEPSLVDWLAKTRAASWRSFAGVRATFSAADAVRVRSGRSVVIFNIAGNRYRLVAAVHDNRGILFVLRFMTHAEYDKQTWKDEL